MELTVYRQQTKQRSGVTVYGGEDARPYVDDKIFFVADGLGGSSAIRHQKIKPELFEEDLLLDTLFHGVFEQYDHETFVRYVKESFFELFAVKDCYTDSVYNIKKGGFFASRCVTAVLLHEMLYHPEYGPEALFGMIAAAESEEKKASVLKEIALHFKTLIKEKMLLIAENANLVYESSLSGLALLGSTLCATIYLEGEGCVEALYLTSGDSRPYLWQEAGGLAQVLEDQERTDGSMTNCIQITEGKDFDIRVNYFKFEKPCVLFNASDGCFDSTRFFSQMAFEKLLLESTVSSESMEEVSKAITDFFVEYGRHDDSSTIALKAFGFSSFEDLRAACGRRMELLREKYLSDMEDLLDVNYQAVCEERESLFSAPLLALKEKLSSEKEVADYCQAYVRGGKHEPTLAAIRAIDEEIAGVQALISKARSGIAAVIAANFIQFRPLILSENEKPGFIESMANNWNVSKIGKAKERHGKTSEEYIASLRDYRANFDQAVLTLSELLTKVTEIAVPVSFEDYASIAFDALDQCERELNQLFELFKGLKGKKLPAVRALTQQRQEYIELNQRFAEKYKDEVSALCEKVISGAPDCREMDLFSDDKAKIAEELGRIAEAESKIAALESEAKEQALCEGAKALWETEYLSVITALLALPSLDMEEALASEARALLEEYHSALSAIGEKSEAQKALLCEYNATYNRYIGG